MWIYWNELLRLLALLCSAFHKAKKRVFLVKKEIFSDTSLIFWDIYFFFFLLNGAIQSQVSNVILDDFFTDDE